MIRIQEKFMKHQGLLEEVVKVAFKVRNVLGLLLVGSVASGTHTEESDIDLIMIYRTYKRASGIKNKWVRGIKVQTIYFTLDTLIKSQETAPYLLHILCDAKVLIDRDNSITPVIGMVKEYYNHHPQIADEWQQQYVMYKIQKQSQNVNSHRLFRSGTPLKTATRVGNASVRFSTWRPRDGAS
jgi:predicted nucleotidyltransferase